MSSGEARVEAQAKLNLFLKVLAREDSGFHQIETLFCRLTLADTVTVRVTASGRKLACSGERLPAGGLGPPESNLAWRAAAIYAEETGFPSGFEIAIEKRIPVGGGLGGGSADAGAVLRALNALNPSPLAARDMLRLAAALGADVPFLTQDTAPAALAWGRGARMLLLPALPVRAVWLLVPDASVNTADAYQWLRETKRYTAPTAIPLDQLTRWDGIAALATNDFEPVVASHVPVIGKLLQNLRSAEFREVLGSSAIVLMSGSGSTVAVITGEPPPGAFQPAPAVGGVSILETESSAFVEPVVLTH
jgi:4-diphosphocytidyl-2-C-methyl-D-erythritol kinase